MAIRDATKPRDVIERRILAIQQATPLTTDEGVVAPNSLLVRALVVQLRAALEAPEPCAWPTWAIWER